MVAGNRSDDAIIVHARDLKVKPPWANHRASPLMVWLSTDTSDPCREVALHDWQLHGNGSWTLSNRWNLWRQKDVQAKCLLSIICIQPQIQQNKYLSNCPWCSQDTVCKDVSGSIGMWVDLLNMLPISSQLSAGWGHHVWTVSTGPAFPGQLGRQQKLLNQATSYPRSLMCIHNRSSFPPIGFCWSGFLWYGMNSTPIHWYLLQCILNSGKAYSNRNHIQLAHLGLASPFSLFYVKHHVFRVNANRVHFRFLRCLYPWVSTYPCVIEHVRAVPLQGGPYAFLWLLDWLLVILFCFLSIVTGHETNRF